MLVAEDLSKSYGGRVALDRLCLEVQAGEVFCLLGANGAGKSTTINLFLGFLYPDAGRALVAGRPVAADPLAARRQLAYIPELVTLYPNFTGVENLAYFSELTGQHFDKTRVVSLLGEAGLSADDAHRRVREYSKGMRQKVGIAIALAKQAKAILMDEPTSGLDPQASNEFAALVGTLRDRGVAILMATHDLFRARDVASRVGIMKHGRLVATLGTADMSHLDLEQTYLDHMRD